MEHIRPNFDRPPLVEQAIVVVFEPISGFSIVDYGLFWAEIRNEFPVVASSEPAAEQTELFDQYRQTNPILELLESIPLPRAMFRDEAGGEAVQVQPDRFGFNWSKVGNDHYPRSEPVMARFEALFAKFCSFVEARGMGPIALKQAELTNLNIIPVRDFGAGYEDITAALRVDPLDLGVPFLKAETYTRVRQHRIIDGAGNSLGRLHTVINPVVSSHDREKALRLELTARSAPDITSIEAMRDFFGVGRDAINAAFCAITTPEMRAHWGEQDA